MHNALDTNFTNGRICTLDRSQPRAEALAVAGSTLVAVGTTVEALRHAGPNTRRIDLHGRRVVPGLDEIHTDNAETINERTIEDAAESGRFIESFLMPSWLKHERQYHRNSRDDEALKERVSEFHLGPRPPRVQHFVAPAASRGAKP